MKIYENLQINYQNVLNILFFSIPVGIALGPLIAEILLNLFTLLIISGLIKNKNFDIFKEKIFIFLYLFYLVILISALLSQNGIIIGKAFFYLRFILFLISAKFFLNQNYLNLKFAFIPLIFFLVVISDALFQIFTGESLFGNKGKCCVETKRFNISGIFFEEEILGSYLSRILPMIIFFVMVYFNKKISITIALLLFLISLWITMFTGERVALFLLLGNFIIFIFTFRKIKYFILTILLIFLTIFGSVQFSGKVYERIIETTKNQIFSKDTTYWISEAHSNHIISSYYIFLDNKILGSGPKSFRIECKKYEDKVRGCSTHPHNYFAQILSETGILGFSLFIFGLIYLYKFFFTNLINFYRKHRSSDIVYFLPIGSLLVQFLPFLPTGSFFNNWLSIILFYTFSLVYLKSKKI